MKRFFVLVALATTALAGCYSTTVTSGKPAGKVASGADDRWHSGVLTGGVELSGPYDLESLCPYGWSEIHTESSPANVVVEFMTFHLYAPQTVRVTCAAAPTREAAAQEVAADLM
jgi:Bor protein